MVAWWTSPAYWKKHNEAKAQRAMMGGGSHYQGSAILQVLYHKKVSKSIIYSSCQIIIFARMAFPVPHPLISLLQTIKTGEQPQFFKFWLSYHERKGPPDPVVVHPSTWGTSSGRKHMSGSTRRSTARIPTLAMHPLMLRLHILILSIFAP
jgi:hypothetical protein